MLSTTKSFIKNNFGVSFCLSFIFFCFLVSIFAYFIIPDDSQHSNQMHLPIHSNPPGFKAIILEIPNVNDDNQSFLSKKLFGDKKLEF